MERVLDTNKYLDAVCQMLENGADSVPVPVKGTSMQPFLRNGDFVFVELPGESVSKGDILLFQRPDGQYVLHRVMRIRGDRYWMQGDSQLWQEPITKEQIRAKAVCAKIRGQIVPAGSRHWRLFSQAWRWLAPIRRQISWMHRLLNRT